MVTQEHRPLAVFRNVRRLFHDFHDGMAIFLRDRHIHARHQGEVIRHVTFVAIAEILAHVFRPLIGFRQKHAVAIVAIQLGAHAFDYRMRLR